MYEGSWICRRICDAYPSEGTREWTEIILGGDADHDLIGKFDKYEQNLSVATLFNRGQTWANIYQGAAIVMHIDDGRTPDQPVNRNAIKSIIELDVLDPMEIRPNITANFNPLKPDFYELVGAKTPNMQKLASGTIGIPRFHPDRILRFDGFDLPPRSMRRHENWGGSLLENIWQSYSRYESGNNAISAMLADFNVFVYALKGLGNLVAASDDKSMLTLKNRLRSLQLTKSNLKGMVIDADGEKVDFVSRNFAGVSDAIAHFKDDLIGASGLPHTAVFGDSPSGLGATGDSEASGWSKMVNQFQEKDFRPNVQRLYEYIWLAKDGPCKGKPPEEWSFKFKPLAQESEETKVANRGAQAQADSTYLSVGVLLKEEVRQSRFGGTEYSFETTLDEDAWKKAAEAEQFDPSQFDLGGEDPAADPNADPNAPPPEDGSDPNAPPTDDGGGNPDAAAPDPDDKQDRMDAATNPRRNGFVFVPEKGDRESYWRKDPRRKRQVVELPRGSSKRFVSTHPQILEGGNLLFSGLSRSDVEMLEDPQSAPPLSFARQLLDASQASANLKRQLINGGATPAHRQTADNSNDIFAELKKASTNTADREEGELGIPRAGLRTIKTRDGVIQSFSLVAVTKAPLTKGKVLFVDLTAVVPHNLSLNGINRPAIRGEKDEAKKAEMTERLQHRTLGVSSAMLEATIKESQSLGLKGRLACYPLEANRPLFAKAGFRFKGGEKELSEKDKRNGWMELSEENAQKFLEMRSQTQKRVDSNRNGLDASLRWQRELNEMEEEVGGLMAHSPLAKSSKRLKAETKTDSAEPRKRVASIAGLSLDITHDPGDTRHHRTMTTGYGRIRGSYGHAEDGKSWDVFVGPNAESDQVYKIRQLDPETLFCDETKYMVGCDSIEHARDLGLIQMGADRFGGIEPVKSDELSPYKTQLINLDSEIKEDSRRIWVDNPEVKNNGFWRTDPRSRHEPSHAKMFVPQLEFGQLTKSPGSPGGSHSTMFVQDPEPDGTELLYKDVNHADLDSAAAEVLCSQLAASVGVRANTTRLVPASLSSSFKESGKSAGTLHSLVPGQSMEDWNNRDPKNPYNSVNIRLTEYYEEKVKAVIQGMVKHPDLARIVALDVFTGENDRHKGNFFYDKDKDHFHAIDMGKSFNIPSTLFATTASGMQRDFAAMPKHEQGNLRIFADTLNRLHTANPPGSLQSRLIRLTAAASSSPDFESRLRRNQPEFNEHNRLKALDPRGFHREEANAHMKRLQGMQSSEVEMRQLITQESLLSRLSIIEQNGKEVQKVLSAVKKWL